MIPDNPPMPDTLVLTWEALDGLVATLAEEVGRDHDLVLAITRGGLVPAGMLAYRLDLREILVAGAVFYRPEGGTHRASRHRPLPGLRSCSPGGVCSSSTRSGRPARR